LLLQASQNNIKKLKYDLRGENKFHVNAF
jgi:hypothetical protein